MEHKNDELYKQLLNINDGIDKLSNGQAVWNGLVAKIIETTESNIDSVKKIERYKVIAWFCGIPMSLLSLYFFIKLCMDIFR